MNAEQGKEHDLVRWNGMRMIIQDPSGMDGLQRDRTARRKKATKKKRRFGFVSRVDHVFFQNEKTMFLKSKTNRCPSDLNLKLQCIFCVSDSS